MVDLITLIGIATWYGPGFRGQPLACGGTFGPGTPIAAVDPSYLERGWQCGDLLIAWDEVELVLMDTGPLSNYYIEQWPDKPIVLDVAEHAWPFPDLSRPVTVTNVSLLGRELRTAAVDYWQ